MRPSNLSPKGSAGASKMVATAPNNSFTAVVKCASKFVVDQPYAGFKVEEFQKIVVQLVGF